MEKIIGIGHRIRKWRKKAGMKAIELAKLLGMSQGALSEIENEKSTPSAATIVAFMERTDIDIYWMLLGKLDHVHGQEKIDRDPPFIINLNSQVNEVLIRRTE